MTDSRTRTLLAVALGAILGLGAIADAQAQLTSQRNERYKSETTDEKQETEAAKYPQATRQEPELKGSSDLRKELNNLVEAYNEEQFAEARTQAAAIIANGEANAYDRAFAAQIAAHSAYDMDDAPAAMASLEQVIQADALGNNAHYGALLMLAQLQLQEGQDAPGLVTLDRFLAETGSQDPELLILKGNTLYHMERYPEAAVATKQALDASADPDPSWIQLLMGIYLEMDQPQEAMRIAEQVAARTPDDKRAQLNLASVYLQNDQMDKAAAVLEKVRASGQLSSDKEYRQLYATYLNMDGKESEAIAVINDGLAKGILKPSHEVYLALAQSYYFSKDDAKAIEFYGKAAPLGDDGDTYLNLAKVLWQAGRIGEAKRAAQQALDKGLDNPAEARKILALPAN